MLHMYVFIVLEGYHTGPTTLEWLKIEDGKEMYAGCDFNLSNSITPIC